MLKKIINKPVGPVKILKNKGESLYNIVHDSAEYAYVLVEQQFISESGKITNRTAKYFGLYQVLCSLSEGDIIPGRIVLLESTFPFNEENPYRNLKVVDYIGALYTIEDRPIYQITFFDVTGEMDDQYIDHDNEEEIKEITKAVIDLERSKSQDSNKIDSNPKNILFFDTETTGLPKQWNAPLSKLDNWPRLVQLAYLIYDFEGRLILEGNHIIKPEGFEIPDDAQKIHGISTMKALQIGESLNIVLGKFYSLIENSTLIVAHNMEYDEKIIGCEFLRIDRNNILNNKKKICTMKESVNFCKIPGYNGYKWPKLSELHYKLFNKPCEEKHNAVSDIKNTAKCFWELKKKTLININY